jgi:hypothetical protein
MTDDRRAGFSRTSQPAIVEPGFSRTDAAKYIDNPSLEFARGRERKCESDD